jgi:hypothetical protein
VSHVISSVCCGFILFHPVIYYNSEHTISLLTVFDT